MEKILNNEELTQLRSMLAAATDVVICVHVGPDGDAIGSALALRSFLLRKGKQATVVTPNIFPDFLKWLPGAESVLIHSLKPEETRAALRKANLVIVADLNQANRLSGLEQDFTACPAPRILIDHHLNPDGFCCLTVSKPDMCATAEVICHLLWQLGELDSLTAEEATCLYTGMMCDTGAFSFNSNRPVIYECISSLLAHGIDKDRIYRNIFWTASEARLRLQGYLLYVNMKVIHTHHTAIITLSNEERRRFNIKNGDTEGIVNIPLQMQGMRMSIFINEDTEHPGVMKLSLRSVDDIPCNRMAAQFFNGGGHKNASGGRLCCSMEEAVEAVRKALDSYSEMLK